MLFVKADPRELPAAQRSLRLLRRCVQSVVATTLEAGIIFHSVFVGITLGVSQEPDIVRSLMIALMFHQVGSLLTPHLMRVLPAVGGL